MTILAICLLCSPSVSLLVQGRYSINEGLRVLHKKVEVGLRNLLDGKQGPIMLVCEIAKLGTVCVTKQGVGP